MTAKQNIFLAIIILILFSMLFLIVLGDHGLLDLNVLKIKSDHLTENNNELVKENRSFFREIDRMKHDLKYVESVARKELGVIDKDEVIIKLNSSKSHASGDKRQGASLRGQVLKDRQ